MIGLLLLQTFYCFDHNNILEIRINSVGLQFHARFMIVITYYKPQNFNERSI